MTERLATLMHEEADLLDIPAPPADAVLRQGRGLRRRRHLGTAAAALAVVAGLAGGAVVASRDGSGGQTTISPADQAYLHGGAFSVGQNVYFGDAGQYKVHLDEKIKALYYTSEGVLARTGTSPWTIDDPSHFSLITPDGAVTRLDLNFSDTVPSTDPTAPYLAYSVADGDGWAVVVRDVGSGDVVAQVPVPGEMPDDNGWGSPPVSISGDYVYVGMKAGASAVNWRTGEVTHPSWFDQGSPEVHGGRFGNGGSGAATVSDAVTGEQLLRVPVKGYGYFDLSPDGRYATLNLGDGRGNPVKVYDVATGQTVTLDVGANDSGWAPDGHLIGLSGNTLTTCDPATGDCQSTEVAIERLPDAAPSTTTQRICDKDGKHCFTVDSTDDQDEVNVVKIGGNSYES